MEGGLALPGMQVSDKNPEGRGGLGRWCEIVSLCRTGRRNTSTGTTPRSSRRTSPRRCVSLGSASQRTQIPTAALRIWACGVERPGMDLDVCNSSVCVCAAAVSRCLLVPGADGEGL